MSGDMILGLTCAIAFVLFILGIWAQFKMSASASGLIKKVPLLPMLVATAAAIFVMLLPGLAVQMTGESFCIPKAVLVSLQHTFQMFLVNGDYGMFLNGAQYLSANPPGFYLLFAAALALVAPVLTAGAILSTLGDVYMYGRLLMSLGKTICVFSVLDERSVLLAESCRDSIGKETGERPKNIALLFVNVRDGDADEYRERLGRLRAITLGANFDSRVLMSFLRHMKEKRFFVMTEDEAENVKESLKLMGVCGDWSRVRIYAFADSEEAELLFGAVSRELRKTVSKESQGASSTKLHGDSSRKQQVLHTDEGLILRRVNPYRALIYNHLYHDVKDILCCQYMDKRVFSVLIVGLGRYGRELAKAFPWYVQLPGYSLQIHIFEKDPQKIAAFRAECPDLLSKSGETEPGEAHYMIRIYNKDTGIDLFSPAFEKKLKKIKTVSRAYVSLGNDNSNVNASIRLRELLVRYFGDKGAIVPIRTIVEDSKMGEMLESQKLRNHRDADYGITLLGSPKKIFSYDVIVHSELEAAAEAEHMGWVRKDIEKVSDAAMKRKMEEEAREKFYLYDYFYRSSETVVIRRHVRTMKEVEGKLRKKGLDADSRKVILREHEHQSWNAYMRSEGYTHAIERNDMGKTHDLLVSFWKLPKEERSKDD